MCAVHAYQPRPASRDADKASFVQRRMCVTKYSMQRPCITYIYIFASRDSRGYVHLCAQKRSFELASVSVHAFLETVDRSTYSQNKTSDGYLTCLRSHMGRPFHLRRLLPLAGILKKIFLRFLLLIFIPSTLLIPSRGTPTPGVLLHLGVLTESPQCPQIQQPSPPTRRDTCSQGRTYRLETLCET